MNSLPIDNTTQNTPTMKLKKQGEKVILLSVSAEDLVNGVFENNTITELADSCFYNMQELVKVVLPKLTTCGNYCFRYNASLTTISTPVLTTCGNDCFRYNASLTTISTKTHKGLNYKCVDGTPFIIESEKSSKGIKIYSGYNFNSMKDNVINKTPCYVAAKGKFTAHGDTIRKAVDDLQWKIVAEKIKNEPITPDTIITVQYYHTVTGSCVLGINEWMKKTFNPKELKDILANGIKAKDLFPILKKNQAYGLEKFQSLYKA